MCQSGKRAAERSGRQTREREGGYWRGRKVGGPVGKTYITRETGVAEAGAGQYADCGFRH